MVSFHIRPFALGAAEANPVVAAAILNWGMIWGLIYNKTLACLLLLLIFALRGKPALTGKACIERDGLGVCVRHYCLSLGTPAVEPPTLGPRHLRRTKYKLGSIPAAYKALPQFPKYASVALSSAGKSRRSFP